MTTRRAVMLAVKALVATALPGAVVAGFDAETLTPAEPGPGGLAFGFPGTPEPAGTDLGALAYHWDHAFPIELLRPPGASDEDASLAAMMAAVGAAIDADRTLGGLVDWLEAGAPDLLDSAEDGSRPLRFANFAIVASYATSSPLA